MIKKIITAVITFSLLWVITIVLVDRAVMPRVVKSGEETVVPKVVFSDIEIAKKEITTRGLVPVIKQMVFSDYPQGYVIEQTPDPGMRIKRGHKVFLVISKGAIGP